MKNNKLNRRSFIQKSLGTAAAAISFPYLINSSALGRDNNVAASERINLGFIGLGGKGFDGVWGALLPTIITNKNFQVRAVCDVDKRYRDRAQNYVNEYYGNKDCDAYIDFREINSRNDIDAVVIATPDHWHAIQTIDACKNGKDVYCEKPLSLTIHEAREMVKAARRYGRVVQTGSQSRSNAGLALACKAVRDGKLGEIKYASAASGGAPILYNHAAEPVPDYLDWDMYVGPAPWRPYSSAIHPASFRFNIDFAGGGVADWGAHHFDLVQWALGKDSSEPVEIIPPTSKDEWLVYKYADGTAVEHINCDVKVPDFFGINLVGSHGSVKMTGIEGTVVFEPEELGKEFAVQKEKWGDTTVGKGHYDNFLECIRNRTKPVADVAYGANTAITCHLVNIAYWLKRPLKWDQANTRFINDDEANKYISRPYRQPWTL